MNLKKRLEILLVEDSPDDVVITKEALKGTKILYNLSVPQDGVEAMAFLRRKDKYAKAPRPDLILLDLNLPKKDGHEVLGEIKADQCLKQIPVIVLTSSDNERDIVKSYDLHANCYITKPSNLNELLDVTRAIESWLNVIKLPRNNPGPRDEQPTH